ERAEELALLQLAGHGPAEARAPEAMIGARPQRLAVVELDPEDLARRGVMDDQDRLKAQGAGGHVPAEDLVADAKGLDRAQAVARADGGPRREAAIVEGGGRHLRWRAVDDLGDLGGPLVSGADLVVPPGAPGILVVPEVGRTGGVHEHGTDPRVQGERF